VALNPKKVLALALAAAIGFYSISPIYFLLVMSLSWDKDIYQVPSPLFPQRVTPTNYIRVLGYNATGLAGEKLRPVGAWKEIRRGMLNSAIVGLGVTALTMAATVPAGYVLGRYRIRYRNSFIAVLLGSRTIPPVSIVVPYYALYLALGLKGTYLGLILIHLTITIPLMTWILMGYFATLPRDLEKAARMDGCGRLQAFTKIVLPFAKPAIATVAILTFLFSWNEFLFGYVLSGGGDVQPYTPFLYTFFWTSGVTYGSASEGAAAVIINLIPPLTIAAALQRYITNLKIVDPTGVVVS
jgi:multiple sugar transport system permease protein